MNLIKKDFFKKGGEIVNTYIIIILAVIIIEIIINLFYKKKKLDKVIEYLTKIIDYYGKHVLNKVKLVLLINILRAWIINNTKNKVLKFFIEIFWPETDLLLTALNIENTNNKNEAVKSIPDIIVSKTVDSVLNNVKYEGNKFNTNSNLVITEKDRGYLEAYLEGQLNKLETARIGIKGGFKF